MPERTVVLVGAGASYGAGRVLPNPPPLGAGLYDALAVKFPKDWGPESTLNQFADGFRRDSEKTMWNEVCFWRPSLDILEQYRQMALYFGQFYLEAGGDDLYSKLIDLFRATKRLPDTTFGSLNYECLLEQAISHSGSAIDYAGDSASATLVLKPQGSCNFVSVDMNQWKHLLTSPASHVECEYETVGPEIVQSALMARFSNHGASFFPIMSLYAMSKDSILASVGIGKIRNRWKERITEASTIIVIGVRPNPEDGHVWDPIIAASSARGFYIGSRAQLESWPAANGRLRFVEETFQAGLPLLETIL